MKYYLITGIDFEFGFPVKDLQPGFYENLEAGEVGVEFELERSFCPQIYNRSDLTEVSKEDYDTIVKLHLDGAESGYGWQEEDEKKLNEILKKATSN